MLGTLEDFDISREGQINHLDSSEHDYSGEWQDANLGPDHADRRHPSHWETVHRHATSILDVTPI